MTKAEMLALARMRMAHGGKTLVPLPDAAKICDIKPATLRAWLTEGRVHNEPNAKRSRPNAIIVDLGEVLTAREASTLKPEGSPLSYREIAVMRLVAAELTNGEIANRTGRGFDTTRDILKIVYAKLGVHSRVGAVVKCLRLGLFALADIEDAPNPMKGQNPGIV